MADIDDLLGGLGSDAAGPRLPLAPAGDVLVRGDRLRRRHAQLVAGAGALLVLAAGGAFYAATSGDPGSDALIAPPSATVTPTAAPPTSTPTVTSPVTPSTTPTPAPRRVAAGDRVTLEGVGPLRLGMTYAQVEAATGQRVQVDDFLGNDGSCVGLELAGDSSGLVLIGSDGRLVLVSVPGDSTRPTASGVRVGDSEARVRRVYGESLEDRAIDFGGLVLRWLVVRPAGSDVELSLALDQAGEVSGISVGDIGLGTSPEGACV